MTGIVEDLRLVDEVDDVDEDNPASTNRLDGFIGKYEFVDSKGVDEYLVGLGVGLVIRKVHQAARPVLEIGYTEINELWTIRMESVFHIHLLKAKFGEEVEDETFDVRKCLTTLQTNEERDKLIITQKCDEGPDVVTIIEKVGDYNVIFFMQSSNYNATQTFQLLPPVQLDDEEDSEEE